MRATSLGFALAGALAACGLEGTALRFDGSDAGAAADGRDGAGAPQGPDDAGDGGAGGDASASGVFTGQYLSCALQRGAAFCWGANGEGEIGAGDTTDHLTPIAVATKETLTSLAGGDVHACATSSNALVECWGSNSYGQLGNGGNDAAAIPAAVPLSVPARQIAAGFDFNCAVASDGTLWCWGDDAEGQLGQGDSVGAANSLLPLAVHGDGSWLAASAGQGHACGIQAPGTMWCWGRNTTGQLGDGQGQSIQVRAPLRVGSDVDWASLDLGQDDACAIKRDGTLWCWGDDSAGQLGLPQRASDGGAAAVYTPTKVGTDADWAQVSIDTFHACAVKRGGSLWCWGRNAEGQLGLGDDADRLAPTQVGTGAIWSGVSVGRFHTCAEQRDGAIFCAGANDNGQLGVGDTNRRSAFTRVLFP